MARKDWRVTRPSVLLKNVSDETLPFLDPSVTEVLRERGLRVKQGESFNLGSGVNSLELNLSVNVPQVEGPPPILSAEEAGRLYRTGLLNVSSKEKINGGVKGSTLLHLKKSEWEQEGLIVAKTFSFDGATTNITPNDPEKVLCDYSKIDFEGAGPDPTDDPELLKSILNSGEVAKFVFQKIISPTFTITNSSVEEGPGVYCNLLPGFLGLSFSFPGFSGEVFHGAETEVTLKAEFYSYLDDDDIRWGIKVERISGVNPDIVVSADWVFEYDEFVDRLAYEGDDISEWGPIQEAVSRAYEERHFRFSTSTFGLLSVFFGGPPPPSAGEYLFRTLLDEVVLESAEGTESFGNPTLSIISEESPDFLLAYFLLSITKFDYFVVND